MRKIYKFIKPTFLVRRLIIFSLLALLMFETKAFNGGTYTINPGSAASSNNYLSFTALFNDLRNVTRGDGGPANYSVGGAGLQGSITVNVSSGTGPYNQQLSIPAILGASSTRTVTINGNGTTLSFTPTSTAAGGVIDLNGADFISFNNLTIVNNATFGYCVWLRNGADFNAFRNCNFRCPSMIGSTTGTAYIWISNGTTSPFSYSSSGNNNVFENNNLRTANSNGPYYGIVMVGPTTSNLTNGTSGNRFINNNIQNWRYCGFFISYTSNTEFVGNTVHNTDYTVTSFKYGIYLNYATGTFDRNRIYNIDGSGVSTNSIYPIYFYNFNNTTRNSTLNNNSVHCRTSGFNYNYIYNYASLSGASLSIVNNTFAHVSGTTVNNNSTTYVVYGGYWNVFRNNLLSCDFQGTGTKYLYYDFSGTSVTSFTHNNFDLRASGTTHIGYVSNQARTTMSDMYSAGFNSTNIAVDPNFIDENTTSDLHPTSVRMCNKGTPVTGITIDLRGNSRNQDKPDIGAIEYLLDISMNAMYVPLSNPMCSGYSSTLSGTLRNNSAFNVTGIDVAYLLNSSAPNQLLLNTVLKPGDTFRFNFPKPIVFSKSGQNSMRLYYGNGDDNASNDTQRVLFNVVESPGGAEFNPIVSGQSIYDYRNKGYSVMPIDEQFELEMSAPRKYSMSDYNIKWTNQIWVQSSSGAVLPNNSIVYNHLNNGKISFAAPYAYLDSTVFLHVKVIDFLTGCDTIYKREIVVAPKGSPKVILPSVLCDGSEIFFDNISTVSSGQLLYQWNFGDGSSIDDATSPVHQFPSFGSYTITMRTITAPYGFTKDSSFVVNINEVPNVKFRVNNACAGTAVRFTNMTTIGNGVLQYEWNMGDGKGSSTAVNTTYNYANTGGYRVTLKAISNGCINEYSRIAYSLPKPIANFSMSSNTFCENEAVVFNNLSQISNGQVGSMWNFSEMNSTTTFTHPSYDFNTPGSKTVQLKAISEFGCTDSISKTVVIRSAPVADFSADFTCSLTPGKLMNTSTIPAGELAQYKWEFGANMPSSNLESPTVKWQSAGERVIRMDVKLGNGCSDTKSKSVVVGEEPIASFRAEDKCTNEDVVFVNTSQWKQGSIKYEWDFGDGFTSLIANPKHSYSNLVASTYTVRLVASVEDGCSDTSINTVTIHPKPSSCDFDIRKNFLNGARGFDFVPLGNTQKIEYTWLMGDGGKVLSNETGVKYNYTFNKKYCVTMIARNEAGCECSQVKCITINTDINDLEALSNGVNVYPNPSNGVFYINNSTEFALGEVKVIDMAGKVVSLSNGQTNELDLTHLESGWYTIEMQIGGRVVSKKLSILH